MTTSAKELTIHKQLSNSFTRETKLCTDCQILQLKNRVAGDFTEWKRCWIPEARKLIKQGYVRNGYVICSEPQPSYMYEFTTEELFKTVLRDAGITVEVDGPCDDAIRLFIPKRWQEFFFTLEIARVRETSCTVPPRIELFYAFAYLDPHCHNVFLEIFIDRYNELFKRILSWCKPNESLANLLPTLLPIFKAFFLERLKRAKDEVRKDALVSLLASLNQSFEKYVSKFPNWWEYQGMEPLKAGHCIDFDFDYIKGVFGYEPYRVKSATQPFINGLIIS